MPTKTLLANANANVGPIKQKQKKKEENKNDIKIRNFIIRRIYILFF